MVLAGSLLMRPGAAEGALRSTRRAWAPAVSRGRPADDVPGLLAAVFSLCGGAHRLTAQAAVAAARGLPGPFDHGLPAALHRETVAEHLRRWWLDAPRLLPGDGGAAPGRLAGCPALRALPAEAADPVGAQGGDSRTAQLYAPHRGTDGPRERAECGNHCDADRDAGRTADRSSNRRAESDAHRDAVRAWVEREVLCAPAAAWLVAWTADPQACARAWTDEARTWPARWTAAARQALDGLALPLRAWPAPDADTAAEIGAAMADVPGFDRTPTWRGAPAETGVWTRAADAGLLDTPALAPLWMRAAARAADLARLVCWDAAASVPPLRCGARSLGPRTGIAWCEMARGVLVHRIALDADDRVRDCRVLAPTEWNTHPQGAWAQVLGACPVDTPDLRLRWVAAVFDPCVECRIDAHPQETAHA